MPSTHMEKIERAISYLERHGIERRNAAPPFFQALWKLGIEARPPLFMNPVQVAALAGIPFGASMYALAVLKNVPGGPSGGLALFIGLFSFLAFGPTLALYIHLKGKALGLESWADVTAR